MVGKLIKHEWIRTRWWLLGAFGLSLVITILLSSVAATRIKVLSEVALGLAYMLAIVFMSVVPLILAIDYWRSSYLKTGYLTQTYPIKGSTNFWVKYAYGAFWSLMGLVWSGVLALVMLAGGLKYFSVSLNEVWPLMKKAFDLPEATELAAYFPWWFVLGLIATLILSALSQPATYYFSISLGNEEPMSNLGIAGPIVVWLVQGFVVQIVALLMLILVPVAAIYDETGVSLGYASIVDVFTGRVPGTPLGAWISAAVFVVVYVWRTVVSWQKKASI